MDIQKSQAEFHSKTDFVERFSTLVDSGAGIIHVRTQEVVRALLAIREHAVVDSVEIREWDVVNGFRDVPMDKIAHITGEGDANSDFNSAFTEPLESLRKAGASSTVRYYVFINPHVYMESNPYASQLVTLYGSILPASSYVVVLLTPDAPIQGVSENVLSLHFNPPGLGELKESLAKIIEDVSPDFEDGSNLDEEDINRICYVGSGLTKNAFDMYAALSLVESGRRGATSIERDDIVAGISIGKTDVVNASEVLELYPSTDISNVGGLENLKDWVNRRKGCYSDAAKDFGVEPPKGIVLVGVPGTGKSLIAKAVSSELGIPLVRMDFGKVFSSLVGSSEARMRSALRQVEAMSPCVLFCVAGHTEVTLSDGTRHRIEDLYAAITPEMGGMEGPVMLQGMNPETGELIDLPLRTIIRTQGKPMVRITSASGNDIEVTTDHRLLVNREGERVWVPAGELIVGDDLVEV
jgi:hypothetical protein